MTPPAVQEVLALADASGWSTCAEKSRESRSDAGQFFTPAPIARCLARWFSETSLDRRSLHLLDPGAGGGALTAAVVDRITALRTAGHLPRLEEITLEAWESDLAFVSDLGKTLEACANALKQVGVQALLDVRQKSYVKGAVRALDGGLFGEWSAPAVTHAILNPPYRKIATRSEERAMISSLGMDVSNLYAAFVWLASRQLALNGELAAITPRSFCNGPYFRGFRRDLVENFAFHRIHVFDSRSEAFSRDAVLQENILFHLSRDSGKGQSISLSTGSIDCPEKSEIPPERFVCPLDANKVIHLAPESEAAEIRTFVHGLPCRLEDLGLEVSTGPVVDFRLKTWLSLRRREGEAPLVYPHCVREGRVRPPLGNASAYGQARTAKKPVAIAINDETRRWLLPVARFVLIKRFSSKEEKRRLVAGVLEPSDFANDLLGLENHLNFFHQRRAGLPATRARGLTRFLNSTVADRYFRQFNGHTQVNASDLRAFRYPDATTLERLGRAKLADDDQIAIDLAMTRLLGAPSVG